ncbi:MAG TPA: SPFH domain-containing protein [Steroidobacteraceae bacterium]|nr:SPFH domain-containing protein [Steroidobacteraceae bacterium]
MTPRSYRTLLRLLWVYAVAAVAGAAFLLLGGLRPAWLPRADALAAEAIASGLGAIAESALLLAATALAAAFAMAAARRGGESRSGETGLRSRWRAWTTDAGWMARIGQAVIVPLGAALVVLSAVLMWPGSNAKIVAVNANYLASFLFALAFVSLIAERTMAAFPEPQLAEAPALRRILLVTTVLLVAAACVELGRANALQWLAWVAMALTCVPCAIALELAVRALARLFLPAPPAATATAVSASLVAGVLTGGPRSPGNFLRTHLGLDFARSWALSFLSRALVPALVGTALFCWLLSGVKLIDLGQRGVYERFGAPVAVLGPGLHLLLPWPLGRLRPVEYGAIHSVAIGVDQNEASAPEVAAEAPPPVTLNRLWESAHSGQASYLVPSPSAGTGQQAFQTVSTEISVLYRVGLTDSQALDSVYTVAQPQELVKQAAGRLVLRYFNSRTLESVLGARRESIAEALRDALAGDLDSHHAGIDVVSVLIEEIHPPAGAASAYHAVQAAQINASASISDELGRASRAAGTAQQEAHLLRTAAEASAAETLGAANAEAIRFKADRAAYATGGRAFLLERRYGNLQRALSQSTLTIVDHRLSPSQAPLLDLRGTGPGTTAAPAANTSSPAPTGKTGAAESLIPEFEGLEQ